MIAFFGTGLLGGNFVRALRRRGEQVQVWNRSPGKARALESVGARMFDDPASADGSRRRRLSLSRSAGLNRVSGAIQPLLAAAGLSSTFTRGGVTPGRATDRERTWFCGDAGGAVGGLGPPASVVHELPGFRAEHLADGCDDRADAPGAGGRLVERVVARPDAVRRSKRYALAVETSARAAYEAILPARAIVVPPGNPR